MYPNELRVDFDLTHSQWFHWLLENATYLQSALLHVWAVHDMALQRPFGRQTYHHLRKTIGLLNEHLSRGGAATVNDAIVAVVMTLTMVADMLGDQTAVRAHLDGLRRMVRLRGGLDDFRGNTKLHIKLGR